MTYYFLAFCCLFMLSCGQSATNKDQKTDILQTDNEIVTDTIISPYPDTLSLGINFDPVGNYAGLKNEIAAQRLQFRNQFVNGSEEEKQEVIDSASQYICDQLLNGIFPFWYETDWDFNGYCSKPQSGSIACGYFVSTTLLHVGFNLNRYTLAQQGPLDEARFFEPEEELLIIEPAAFADLKKKVLEKCDDGLYFVGLGCHVGYLLIKQGELYFINSSHVLDKVVFENAEFSAAFLSDIYIIGDISHNKSLIEKWIMGTEVKMQ